jgi:hypothetical protein
MFRQCDYQTITNYILIGDGLLQMQLQAFRYMLEASSYSFEK